MITLTLIETKKDKGVLTQKRKIVLFHSMDKARKEIVKIKKNPAIKIDGVSYDDTSEKALLLETKAIISIDNEN